MIETKHADVVIVGAGMGGISAAIWGHRLELSFLLLEQGESIGGQLHHMHNTIPDYPGMICDDGQEFTAQLRSQMERLGIVPHLKGEVQDVDVNDRKIRVDDKWISCKALVVATGLRRRRLHVPGAERLMKQGISMTFSGRRGMFEGRKACIVGGGDGAFENALMMTKICSHITIVYRGECPKARTSFQEQVNEHSKIDVLLQSDVVAVEGSDWVEAVQIQGPKGNQRLETDALLVKIGMEPQVEWLQSVDLVQEKGYLQVNEEQQTNVPWIWAIGDVCTPVDPSLSVAAGQACLAMRSIERYLGKV